MLFVNDISRHTTMIFMHAMPEHISYLNVFLCTYINLKSVCVGGVAIKHFSYTLS